ncbi:DUF3301 domain-containing protein [Thalassotalea sp. HSM 43]|uniref:DUF3301 domain-containing protein n=1 Tax=Thalassotalea sp. HSM 43 TaxID=2552945 RepID=UPI0010822E94|nr:DUF3301 domain-containing protein [Thalassotalea sp. HSM 43]QBY03233.1 DUF3301 domain-containing protein [Thalassotalea sp. HSM 43]
MVLSDIYLLLGLFLLVWYIWFSREIAEIARNKCQQYCEQHGLQFISIARTKTRIRFSKRQGLYIHAEYLFEFSGDGESAYAGTLIMHSKKVAAFDLPPYKV